MDEHEAQRDVVVRAISRAGEAAAGLRSFFVSRDDNAGTEDEDVFTLIPTDRITELPDDEALCETATTAAEDGDERAGAQTGRDAGEQGAPAAPTLGDLLGGSYPSRQRTKAAPSRRSNGQSATDGSSPHGQRMYVDLVSGDEEGAGLTDTGMRAEHGATDGTGEHTGDDNDVDWGEEGGIGGGEGDGSSDDDDDYVGGVGNTSTGEGDGDAGGTSGVEGDGSSDDDDDYVDGVGHASRGEDDGDDEGEGSEGDEEGDEAPDDDIDPRLLASKWTACYYCVKSGEPCTGHTTKCRRCSTKGLACDYRMAVPDYSRRTNGALMAVAYRARLARWKALKEPRSEPRPAPTIDLATVKEREVSAEAWRRLAGAVRRQQKKAKGQKAARRAKARGGGSPTDVDRALKDLLAYCEARQDVLSTVATKARWLTAMATFERGAGFLRVAEGMERHAAVVSGWASTDPDDLYRDARAGGEQASDRVSPPSAVSDAEDVASESGEDLPAPRRRNKGPKRTGRKRRRRA